MSRRAIPNSAMDQAALWVARRDRGLTAPEQDEYLLWLQADPRHSEALARHTATLQRMMRLYEWQPAHTSEPNPDLFAPMARHRWRWAAFSGAAAAIAVLLLWGVFGTHSERALEAVAKSYLRVNERMALPDGSRVEVKEGSQLVVQYSERERRVQLMSGEAHFTVWKDPERPFVVQVGDIGVFAVGTAFNVRRDERAIDVLVTSGKIRLETSTGDAPRSVAPEVGAGEQATVRLTSSNEDTKLAPAIRRVTIDEISQALSWQAPRLQFEDTPLAEAILQFNRLNRSQLVLGEPMRDIRVGGTFRPDKVDAFVRLLEITFKIRAERRGPHEIVLRRGP